MWFYLSPLFRDRPSYRSSTAEQTHSKARSRHNIRIADPEINLSSLQDEKKSLISWIHRSSLGRFIDITGRIHTKVIDRDSDDHAKLKVNLKHGPTKFDIRPLGVEDYQIFNLRGALPPSSLPIHFGHDILLDAPHLQAQPHDGSPVPMLTPPPPVYTAHAEGSSPHFDLRRHQSPPLTCPFVHAGCHSPGEHSDPIIICPHHTLKLVSRKSATDHIAVSAPTYMQFPHLHLSSSRSLNPPSPPTPSRQSSNVPIGA